MMKIFKYEISLKIPRFKLYLPGNARILSFQMQRHIPMLWILVDPEIDLVPVNFVIHGTGHDINFDEIHDYIGTVQDGSFVWHLFEAIS